MLVQDCKASSLQACGLLCSRFRFGSFFRSWQRLLIAPKCPAPDYLSLYPIGLRNITRIHLLCILESGFWLSLPAVQWRAPCEHLDCDWNYTLFSFFAAPPRSTERSKSFSSHSGTFFQLPNCKHLNLEGKKKTIPTLGALGLPQLVTPKRIFLRPGLFFCLVLVPQAFDGCEEGHLIFLLCKISQGSWGQSGNAILEKIL